MKTEEKRTILQAILALALGVGLTAAMAWYYDVYIRWNPRAYPFAVAALAAGVILLTLAVLWQRGGRKPACLAWKSAVSLAVFLLLLIGVSFVINNVMRRGAALAAHVSLPLGAAQIYALLVLLLLGMAKQGIKLGAVLAGIGTALAMVACVLLLWEGGSAGKYLTRKGLEPYQAARGQTAIHFINTGGGDAILLESNGLFALIDAAEDSDNLTGSAELAYDGYERYVLGYVKRATGGKNLNFILGTHAHSDHIGGFDTLILDPEVTVGRAYLKRYDPAYKKDYELGWDNQEVYDQMVSALFRRGVPLIQDMPAEPFALGEFKITIFNGEYDEDPSQGSGDENDNSMGVLVEALGLRAFLGGDMNNHSGDETRLAPEIGEVDLLKSPHHGAEGSNTAEFITALRPKTVVITSGPGGGNLNVLRRFDKLAKPERVMCTGDFGGIVAVFGEEGIAYYAVGEYPSGIGGVNMEHRQP